jgi:hypothetical protein
LAWHGGLESFGHSSTMVMMALPIWTQAPQRLLVLKSLEELPGMAAKLAPLTMFLMVLLLPL